MKYLFISLFLLVPLAEAAVEDCDPSELPLLDLAASISVPNCHKKEILKNSLCSDCLTRFEKNYNKKISENNRPLLQKTFVEASLKEFKKILIHNMVEALKMSALPDTGATFERSIKACKFKTLEDFSQDCRSPEALQLLKESVAFNGLNQEIAGELATILATEETNTPTKQLLHRTQNACFVRERDVLQITSAALEEEFTPEVIAAIKLLDPSKMGSVEEIFMSDGVAKNLSGDFMELLASLKLHPLLREHFRTPHAAISFFKTIKDPQDINRLRENLYNKNNGDHFDKELAQSCERSYQNFKKSICSPEFSKGDIDLAPEENYPKLSDSPFEDVPGDLASSEETIEKNISLLSLCSHKTKAPQISFKQRAQEITADLDPSFQAHTLKQFEESKYFIEMGGMKAQLCDMTDCQGSFTCKVKMKYKKMKGSENLDAKLARSSNESANELLRSMIGDTSGSDPKTKEILIAHGIIPRPDGKFVTSPEVPERKPDYFTQLPSPSNSVLPSLAKLSSAEQKNHLASHPRVNRTEYMNEHVTESQKNFELPDFKDLLPAEDEELKNLQNEIRRRLQAYSHNRALTNLETKNIVRESFKSAGRKSTPIQENAIAERIMNSLPPRFQSESNFHQEDSFAKQSAQVSEGENSLTKWKKNQMNEALSAMQGVRSPASEDIPSAKTDAPSNPKDLTTVAINVAEDPKVTLADVLTDKIARNDAETQVLKVLVRSQKNFILQIKDVNFRVIFDEQKKLRLLVESGNPQKAQELRPQVEIFLRKISSPATFNL